MSRAVPKVLTSVPEFALGRKLVCGLPFLKRAQDTAPPWDEKPFDPFGSNPGSSQFEAALLASNSEMISVWGPVK
jgi:hypothetical protein